MRTEPQVAQIAIPDPSLVVLIGAAGAGKSTFAARHFAPSEILSSDGFRRLIAGDETDQSATRAAFGRLHRELAHRLAQGRMSVVDATNVDRPARHALLRRSAAAGLPAIAIVLDLPADVVLARNAGRVERIVDDRIVRQHLARLRWSIDRPGLNLESEGFSRVVHLRDPRQVDAVNLVRTGVHQALTQRDPSG